VSEPTLHIALMHPEIPGNTGSVGRIAAGVGARLHLIHPLGFSVSEKAVRRAGLDYWSSVDLQQHADAEAFWAWLGDRPILALSARADRVYTEVRYPPGVVLLFGRETVGLPDEVLARVPSVRLPLPGPVRSLNLANAVAVAVYGALRDLRPDWHPGPSSG
jgi:tRNA (cytidine/uridine-2'-O-)-methyltransferase